MVTKQNVNVIHMDNVKEMNRNKEMKREGKKRGKDQEGNTFILQNERLRDTVESNRQKIELYIYVI